MFVSPMLLERTVPERIDQAFNSDYISELKLDGIRLLLSKFNNKIHLYTRHHNECTAMFPEIYQDSKIPNGTILDGELIVPGKDGAPNFEAVMERFKSKKSGHYLQYCVFDIIYFNGQKVTSLSLLDRKEIIMNLALDHERIVPVQWIEGNGVPFFNLIKEKELEGIVLKKKDSKYEINKRSKNWLKVINYKYQDVFITGMTKRDHSFLLSSMENGQPIGVMEFVPNGERKKIYAEARHNGTVESDKYIRFNKEIPCNIKFRNWTSKGHLHIPSFHQWIS